MADGYVLITLGGVQSFVAASRRTADLWTSSRLMSRLCQVAFGAAEAAGARPVLPSSAGSADGLPNRLFAVVPEGDPADVAVAVTDAVATEWRRLAAITFPTSAPDIKDALSTMPSVRWVGWAGDVQAAGQDYAPGADAYGEGWRVCQRALAARKRIRDFAPYVGQGRQPCSLCGVREGDRPAGRDRRGGQVFPGRLRVAPSERLCAPCAVKRDPRVTDDLAGARAAFPSTASVATAPFRRTVVDLLAAAGGDETLAGRVAAHRTAVCGVVSALRAVGAGGVGELTKPGAMPRLENAAGSAGAEAAEWVRLDGAWCLADTWQASSLLHEHGLPLTEEDSRSRPVVDACAAGRAAVADLVEALARPTEPDGLEHNGLASVRPAPYLALIMQDADDMGRSLAPERAPAGLPVVDWHRRVSAMLVDVAAAQSAAVEDLSGRAVYAGGDDLLAMVPARHALAAAGRCRRLFLELSEGLLSRRAVSTAVVFFHAGYPLQDALARARRAVDDEAKKHPGKAGLAVVVLRGGGETAASVLPWQGRGTDDAAEALDAVAVAFRGGLSPRFAFDLRGSRHGIAELARTRGDYLAEVRRLVARHTAPGTDVAAVTAAIRAVEPVVGRLGPADVQAWVGALDVARFVAQEGR